MDNSSYIKMPAAEVLALCGLTLAHYQCISDGKVARYAACWRKKWVYRIALWFGCKPLSDLDAARRWAHDGCCSLTTGWEGEVERLRNAARTGHEMLVSISDYDLIKG